MVLGQAPDFAAIAKDHGADPDEVETMYRYGCRAWSELAKYFPNPEAEKKLKGDGIQGTADLFSQDSQTMTILDWKTNRIKRDAMPQVKGYGACAVDQYGMPESGTVDVIVVWLRFGEYEVKRLAQDDIERFYHEIERAKLRVGKDYSPGEACTFCKRQLECRARCDYSRAAAASLCVVPSDSSLTPAMLGGLYHKAKFLKAALAAYDKALKMALREADITDENGDTLTLEVATRDKIDPLAAWPELVGAGFTEEELASCVSIGKTAALKIYGNKAAKGQKGKAKAQLIDRLREAGAIQQTSFETVKVKK
jgi:hypothetical protein